MKPIKVRVTRAMCREGHAGMALECPVALGVTEATGCLASVACDILWGYDGGWQHGMRVPASVRRFIRRFDAGKPVKPFTFMLRAAK